MIHLSYIAENRKKQFNNKDKKVQYFNHTNNFPQHVLSFESLVLI